MDRSETGFERLLKDVAKAQRKQVDLVVEEADVVEIRVQRTGGHFTLCVDVNGETVLRVGGIGKKSLALGVGAGIAATAIDRSGDA